MDLVQACRQFIGADSSPSQGTAAVVEVAKELSLKAGLEVEIQSEFFGDIPQANILVRRPGAKAKEEFLLQTHLDTPDPGPFGLWTQTGLNPFDAHVIEGKIYGLGAADVKLDFVCKLIALTNWRGTSRECSPVLAGTFGEELGMMGALKLIRKEKINAKWALIGEPSNLHLFSAGKGFASVEILIPYEPDERAFRAEHNLSEGTATQSRIFRGVAAHSSTPHLGESAIRKMLNYLKQMPEDLVILEIDGGVNFNTVPAQAFLELDLTAGFDFPMARKLALLDRATQELEDLFVQFKDSRFTPPHPTLNIGLIRSFEDHILISGSCRMPPIITTDIYDSWMERLQKVCRGLGGVLRIQDYKKPYQVSEGSELVKGAQRELAAMGLSSELKTQASTNEASLFSRVGIECISFGPGARDGNIHTPSEHVAIEDLKKATVFYERMIERFCQ